jgi:C4-dicarboxylate-specific signal transduction histidine kinase
VEKQDLAFASRITAAMTHEINNVLATIREASGLLEDILSIRPEAPLPHREKFVRVLATIQEQVNRGVDLSTRLNRFAHNMDETVNTVNLDDFLDHTVSLMRRFARLQRIELRAVPSRHGLMIHSNLLRLHVVVCACIEYCMNRTEVGGIVTLESRLEDGRPVVKVSSDNGDDSGSVTRRFDGLLPLELADIEDLSRDLRVEIRSFGVPDPKGLLLFLPEEKL